MPAPGFEPTTFRTSHTGFTGFGLEVPLNVDLARFQLNGQNFGFSAIFLASRSLLNVRKVKGKKKTRESVCVCVRERESERE